MKNKIDDLRNHLFETLEALKDDEKPMELARAKAIADVAQVIINSAPRDSPPAPDPPVACGNPCAGGALSDQDRREYKVIHESPGHCMKAVSA